MWAYVRRRDALGRRELFKFDAEHMIAAMPHLFMPRMRRVPSAGITEEKETEFLVSCPCGHHPVIDRDLGEFQKCGGCQRHYVTFTQSLYVLYGAMPMPGEQAAEASEAPEASEPSANS